VTGNEITWPQVAKSAPQATPFDRKSSLSGRRRPKTRYTAHFTAYKAIARSRWESRDQKLCQWPQVSESDLEVTSFDQKSPGSGRKRPKTRYTAHFTFYKAQACSRMEYATGNDVTWPGDWK